MKKKAIIFDTDEDKKSEVPEETFKEPVEKKVKEPYRPKYVVKAEGEDAANFDFVEKRTRINKAGLPEAITHLVCHSLGVTIFCLCDQYMKNGLTLAAIMHIIITVVMCYSSYSLTRSAQKVYGYSNTPQMTYPDLAQAAMDISTFPSLRNHGGKFKGVAVAVVVTILMGKCCINQLVIAELLNSIITSLKYPDQDIRKIIAVVMVPLLLICMIRSVEYIGPFMFGTYFFSVLVCLFILIYGSWAMNIIPLQDFLYDTYTDGVAFFYLCGGCAFTIDTTTAVLTVENSMEKPKKIYKVIMIGMSISTVLCSSVNIISAYLATIQRMQLAFMFQGFNPKAWFVSLLTFCICFIAFISFALDVYIIFNLLWVHLKKFHSKEKYWITERMYRASIIVLITVVGLIFPSISFFISFFGALGCIMSNFIIVPIIEFLVDTRVMGLGKYKWKVIRLVALTLPGAILVVGGVVISLYTYYDMTLFYKFRRN